MWRNSVCQTVDSNVRGPHDDRKCHRLLIDLGRRCSGVSLYDQRPGQGPAWSNSLFEDNAEFGYGMFLANQTRREALAAKMQAALVTVPIDLQGIMQDWIDHREESAGSQQRAAKLQAALQQEIHQQPSLQAILDDSDLFVKPSQWMIGGDGWAYDIGFGGIDHVLASGADVNILVLDNEVYSNTGGQVSKSNPNFSDC